MTHAHAAREHGTRVITGSSALISGGHGSRPCKQKGFHRSTTVLTPKNPFQTRSKPQISASIFCYHKKR